MLNVYLGFDAREAEAYRVAESSIVRNSSQPVAVHKLDCRDLYRWRLLWRPVEGEPGKQVDHLSGARQSTEFATSRFLVPFLQRDGWALFVDSDIVCLGDVAELFALADPRFAVMCVKHDFWPMSDTKMDGQVQAAYARKAWSSVVMWNCAHRANLRLTPEIVNGWRGSQLHQFCWLADEEIGGLPPEWNWLVGVAPEPTVPKIAHYTLGGPWLPDWTPREHDSLWLEARKQC